MLLCGVPGGDGAGGQLCGVPGQSLDIIGQGDAALGAVGRVKIADITPKKRPYVYLSSVLTSNMRPFTLQGCCFTLLHFLKLY